MNIFICFPQMHIAPATRKKRAPRATNEYVIKGMRGSLQNPADIVTALYGMGVNPAIRTAQFW